MALHSDLIKQAREPCDKDPKRPRQASLRRAISAAYYALFHCLISGATRAFISDRHKALRPLLGRSFTHKNLLDACDRLLKHVKDPRPMASVLGTATCSSDLKMIAEAFGELQQAREEADYNTAKLFTRSEASDLIDLAAGAIVAFDRGADDLHRMLLLSAFLAPAKMIVLKKE